MALKFNNLTRLKIRALKYPGKIFENGISFERLPNGDGRYKINISVEGRRIHRTIGLESDGTTRSQAEIAIEEKRTDARNDRFNLPTGRKIALGFEDAAKIYITKLKEGDGKDIKMKQMRLDHNLIRFFKNKSLGSFTPFDFDRFRKSRLDGKISSKGKATKATINRDLAVVSHMFSKGVEWGWFKVAPCKVRKDKEQEGKIVFLTKEQIERFLDATKKSNNPILYPFSFIAINSAMRRMEVLSIRIEHINFDNKTIFIPDAKAGARTQKITPKLTEYLKKYIERFEVKEGWLFPAPKSKRGHAVAIEKPFRVAVKLAGLDVKVIGRHTLRHTAITHMIEAGLNLPMVQKLAGHKRIETTLKYIHQSEPALDKAMDQYEKHLEVPKARNLKVV